MRFRIPVLALGGIAVAAWFAPATFDPSVDTAVIQEIHEIHKAQANYYSQFQRYAGGWDSTKQGYRFAVRGGGESYTISATPEAPKRASFFSDQSLAIVRTGPKN